MSHECHISLPNDVIDYIYKLIHNDRILNLNREYKDLVVVYEDAPFSKGFNFAGLQLNSVSINHPRSLLLNFRSFEPLLINNRFHSNVFVVVNRIKTYK